MHWYRSYITLVRTRKPWYCFLYSRISCWSCNHTFILLLGGVVAQEHRQLVLLAPFGVLQSSPPIIKTIAVGKSDSAHSAGVNTTNVWCSHICGVWVAQGLAHPRHHTCVIFYTSVVSGWRKACARSCAPQTPHMCNFLHICGVWDAQEALEAEYHYHHQIHWMYVMYDHCKHQL